MHICWRLERERVSDRRQEGKGDARCESRVVAERGRRSSREERRGAGADDAQSGCRSREAREKRGGGNSVCSSVACSLTHSASHSRSSHQDPSVSRRSTSESLLSRRSSRLPSLSRSSSTSTSLSLVPQSAAARDSDTRGEREKNATSLSSSCLRFHELLSSSFSLFTFCARHHSPDTQVPSPVAIPK